MEISPSLSIVQTFPQTWMTLRTQQANDFAYSALLCNITALVLWTFYGVCIWDAFLTLASVIVLASQMTICVVKMCQGESKIINNEPKITEDECI